jgi:hypothetical protein
MGKWMPETCRENRNKHTWKRIVRQVGYLQRLYRDEWSAEYKIVPMAFKVLIQVINHRIKHYKNKQYDYIKTEKN